MAEDFSQINRYTTKVTPPPHTLGVEGELRRFAMNEYLETRDNQVLVGASDQVFDQDPIEDELLLTNAITENTVQDKVDKTRYLKEVKSYITVNSSARTQLPQQQPETLQQSRGGFGSNLYSTGGNYGTLFNFAPFVFVESDDDYYVHITSDNNLVQIKLQDISNAQGTKQVLTPDGSDEFSIYLPIGKYGLDDLQRLIQTTIEQTISKSTDRTRASGGDPCLSFKVNYNPNINPDRIMVQVISNAQYQFSISFGRSKGFGSQPIAPPVPVSDGAYVVQNPSCGYTDITYKTIEPTIYPFPNCYALDLDKNYTNVKSIRVVHSRIPNTDTIINPYNNHFTFTLRDLSTGQDILNNSGGVNWDVYMAFGNYDLPSLTTYMQTLINAMIQQQAGLSDVFTIASDVTQGTFAISTPDPYTFTWEWDPNPKITARNLYNMLGFTTTAIKTNTQLYSNLVDVNIGTKTHPVFVKQPAKAIVLRKSNVVWLQLNNLEAIYDTFTGYKYFCSFSLDKTPDNTFALDKFSPNVYVFVDIPLAIFNSVDVRLYDEDGQPYNFNMVDHSFELELVRHADFVMGFGESSRRGVNDKTSYV